jgi:hypothetical protein
VSERCERASVAAVSAEALRLVGTGGSLAGKEGTTVRCGAAGLAGVVVLEAAGFAGVVEVDVDAVGAAFGVLAHAARIDEDAKLR